MTQKLPPGLQDHLDGGVTTLCWCWRLTRRDGAVFGFTDHDRALSFDGTEFEPESGFTASEIRAGTDLAVDAQDAQGVLSSGRITETDIIDGLWDDAVVDLWRVNWSDSAQRLLMRRGSTGQMRRGHVSFITEVRSLAYRLNQTTGRTYQPTCGAIVGDARCRVDLTGPAFTASGAVLAVETDHRFTTAALGSYAPGWFDHGTLIWQTGANAGREVEVRTSDVRLADETVTLDEPPVRPVAPGDSFTIVAGCDKTQAACRLKFGNLINFRGFPHIPGQDTVLRYGKQGGSNSGEVL